MISVLYVDDEPDLLEITREFLQLTGEFEVAVSLSAAEALEMMSIRPYDIIVSDYQMPGMDGIGLLKEVRDRFGDTPFILFTGRGREEVVIEAINNGADFYIQKGGDPTAQFAELGHKVRMSVERKNATKALIHYHERFKAVTDNMDAAIYVADMDTREILFVNKYIQNVWGDVVGKRCWETLQAGQTGPCPFCTNEKLVDADGNPTGILVWEFENTITKRWYEINDSAIRWTDGRIVRLEIATDITERRRSESALRESEQKFSTVFKNSPVAMTLVSLRDKTFVDINDAFVRNSGYSREETIGKTAREIGLFAGENDAEKIINAVKNQKVATGIEVKFRAKNQEVRSCLYSTSFLKIGEETYILSSIEDINNLKMAERALHDSEEKFRALVETSPEMIWEIDKQGKFVYISPSVTRLMGYLPEEFTGQSIADMVTDEARPGVIKRLMQYIAMDGPLPPFEVPSCHRDGRDMVIEIRPLSIKDEDGRIIGLRGVAIDITDRRTAEDNLRESEEKFRSIVETSPDMIWEIDQEGRFRYMSPGIIGITGFTPGEIIGKSIMDLTPVPARTIAQEHLVQMIHNTGPHAPFEVPSVHRDGRDLILEIRPSPLRGADGTLTGYRGIAIDITDRRRTEDALRAANRQLGLLSGITRHDILNKVSIIRGFVEMAKRKITDPQVQENLRKIDDATTDIRAQIEFTRIYENIGTHQPQWIALESILPFDQIPQDITLNADVAGVEIMSDPMLEKVFFNLLDNTVRHGSRVTEITVNVQEQDNGLVIVWEDNGTGIPEAEKERIFERGFGKNTGLGLFLAREILSLTGIFIRETGEEGKGARFEIQVPKGSYRIESV